MLRISKTARDTAVTLKLEGKLLGAWVEEAREVCQEIANRVNRTQLDLSELTFVDAAGAALLRDLVARGAEVVSCSHFVSEVLQMEKKPCRRQL